MGGMRRIPRGLLFVLAIALFAGIPSFAEFYTDWLWFREVGYEDVFVKSLSARATTGTIVGTAVFVVLWLNLRLSLRLLRRREFAISTPEGPRVITVDTTRLRSLIYAAALGAAILIGLYSAASWSTWLYALNATSFGRTDPVLGRDIAFYVFRLPALELVYGIALTTVLLAIAGVGGSHVASGNLTLDPIRGVIASGLARRHLSVLAAGLLLVLAFGAWLRVPQLLTSSSSVVFGASYVDVHARMPMYRLQAAAALIGAGLALYQAVATKLTPLMLAIGLYLTIAIGGSAYAGVIQRFVVAPNEQVRQTPYITSNIRATREAYALDRVEERTLSGEATLTTQDLARNAITIENVPLWNDQPLLNAVEQLQEIRTYYDFHSVDNDRYTINGKYRQVMLSARELSSRNLPSRTWINEQLTFTHGYGLTVGPVNEVTPEGLPVLFIRDLPPASTVDLSVTQPAIYFGELTESHAFVRTKTPEFDYPRGEDNVYTTYQGTGGVPIGGLFRRLLFALRFGSTDTFFSPNLTADSRVLMHRLIADRVKHIAPFLSFDPDPYLAVSSGRLIWIQDAYTTTNRYPYSSPSGPVNYIRNAVKVTIDAYHGTTTFHLLDSQDPIAATIAKVFPSLFKPLSDMPADLRARLRYPQGIFTMQAAMFATFHMTNPATFYNREDQWEIPAIDVKDRNEGPERMEPYYTIMKLPGERNAEYIQMLPYTPRQKDNLAAWMAARSDGANYGRLVVFQFPKQTVIFGPRQIAARISQDQVIAPQITLWNQQGSEVIQGTLLVIPIEESLIYIRPLYLRAKGGRIPELKRVIVAYQNQIVMEPTLDAALDRLFERDPRKESKGATLPPPEYQAPPPTAEEVALAVRAKEHFDRALQAQREGNWALYGEEIKRLGEVLAQMTKK